MSNFYNRIQIFILHFYCTNKNTCRHLYISKEERQRLREEILRNDKDRFIAFWNNRNARRKQSGTLIWWWKEWLDKIRKQDITKILSKDKRILEWWNGI